MLAQKILFLTVFLFGAISCSYLVQQDQKVERHFASKEHQIKNRDIIIGKLQFTPQKDKNFPSPKQHLERQWGLKDISISKAWEILQEKIKETPLPPIIVAVVDTGIHTRHPCLKNRLWTNKNEIPNNGKDDDNNGFIDDIHGWNFVNDNNNILDRHGHGTHVSGIIASQGKTKQSPTCEVAGVNPYNIQIMTLKYFDENANHSNIQNTVKAIKYAVNNGADIINYSGGGPGENKDEKSIIAKAADKGIILVAALGNEGLKIGQKEKYYPASYELANTIFVQSKGEGKGIIQSSNLIQLKSLENKQVQTAPGENIISTLPPKMYVQRNWKSNIIRSLASPYLNHNHYGFMTGTSQATAFATGVVALVKATYPDWPMEQLINQVEKTGFGQGTEQIKEVTNQGKKLSAYEALIMRDRAVTAADQIIRENCYDLDNPENRKEECDRGGALLQLHKTNKKIENIKGTTP